MRPIVMLGEFTGKRVPRLQELGWGRMWMAVDRRVYTYPGEPWGFDNAAFRHYLRGESFNGHAYQRRLWRKLGQYARGGAREHDAPYLAVVPDIVAGGLQSLAFSALWLPACIGEGGLREHWPWYLAVQDGMTPSDVRRHLWRGYRGIFLGGTDEFKKQAGTWCQFAHDHGLRFHYGRAGTLAKLQHAIDIGADSLDSAVMMWKADRWQRFADAWLAAA